MTTFAETPVTGCDHLHGAFGPGCPHCMPQRPAGPAVVEELRNAWVTAPRYDEPTAWAALYEALYPVSEPKRVWTCPVCLRSTTGQRCGHGEAQS
jgi:hypothetical protein